MLDREANLKSTDGHIDREANLFEYTFEVSPSRIDKDSSESKGQGTLLHVIKRESKA